MLGDYGQNYKNIVGLVKALNITYVEKHIFGCPAVKKVVPTQVEMSLGEKKKERKVWVWAEGPNPKSVAQWKNATWAGVFDGVQARCGLNFVVHSPDHVEVAVNMTMFDTCRPLMEAVHSTGGHFEVWLASGIYGYPGGIPQECLTSPAAAATAAASARKVVHDLGIDGLSLDDESDCSPRSTVQNFTAWVNVVNQISDTLAADGRTLSAAVQAMFGIQEVEYKPLCSPPWDPSCSQACNLPPWGYTPSPVVESVMKDSSIGRWLVMDTYYFTTARFLDTLDWYSSFLVPDNKMSVAMMNRADFGPDDYAARFHAIHQSNVDLINLFMMPIDDAWLPWYSIYIYILNYIFIYTVLSIDVLYILTN